MDTLRSIGYTRGSCLAMDPSKGGMAIQGPAAAAAAAAASHNCLQQFPYDPGFADPRGGSSGGGFHPFSPCSYSPPTSHLFSALSEAANCNLREISGKSEPGNDIKNTNKPSKRSSSGHHHQDLKVSPQERRREVCEMWTGDVERNCDGEGGEDEGNINAQEKSSCSGQQTAGSEEEGDGGGAPLIRKRKSSQIGEEHLDSVNATRDGTGMAGDEADAKRLKSSGASPRGSDDVIKLKTESEHSGDSSPRCLKATSKPPEPPKQDYIHVRARRGQATDSHSLAERVRREKISERMKYLQDLVPGCSKVTGKAVMLDEIINYVQSLQRQIEFLSMKLAAVNPRFDFNIDSLLNKVEMTQSRSPDTTLMGPDSTMAGGLFRDHHYGLKSNEIACDSYLRRSMAHVSLVSADEYMDSLSQASTVCDGDLQSIVQMGFNQGGQGLFTHGLHGPGFLPAGHLKVEL